MQRVCYKGIVSILVLLLVGCSGSFLEKLSPFKVYKIDVQQGNVITQEQVNKLKPGMDRRQVQFILGTPILQSTFDPNKWYYHYRYKPAYKQEEVKQLVLHFEEGRLARLEGDMKPE